MEPNFLKIMGDMIQQVAGILPRIMPFLDQESARWDAIHPDERRDLIERAAKGLVNGNDIDSLVRRHVYILIKRHEGSPVPYVREIIAGYDEEVASQILVDSFRIMDWLSNGDNIDPLLAEVKKELS